MSDDVTSASGPRVTPRTQKIVRKLISKHGTTDRALEALVRHQYKLELQKRSLARDNHKLREKLRKLNNSPDDPGAPDTGAEG